MGHGGELHLVHHLIFLVFEYPTVIQYHLQVGKRKLRSYKSQSEHGSRSTSLGSKWNFITPENTYNGT